MHARQGQFSNPHGDQPASAGEDGFNAPTSQTSSSLRNDAKRAVFVTAGLDFQVPTRIGKGDVDWQPAPDVLGDTARQVVFDRQDDVDALHGRNVGGTGDRIACLLYTSD